VLHPLCHGVSLHTDLHIHLLQERRRGVLLDSRECEERPA
jgi:hypothetical protein